MQLGETLVESIFSEAMEQPTPAERAAFLDRVCSQDPTLRRRVEQLLGAEQQLGNFLNAAPIVDFPIPGLEAVGTAIGPYRLRELLGEGGMGTVYVAEQSQPVRRIVALKVIKAGMDSREVIARFEAERQALALMDHPYIAKVLDVGTTETGRPYFVMELIRGMSITEDCDRLQSTTRQRLKLFIKVCQGMQHAHSKGIVHRDLKPSNVLVTHFDDDVMPKIIDFGVAKAMDQRLTEHTIYTRFAQVIGSPLYMSPEQAELNASDVDIRSDVYSLGVLLYELLTGTTPFDGEMLKQVGLDGWRKKICEEEPPKPSTRLSTLDEAKRSTVCERRGTDSRRLKVQLRGDLDWIVMKALDKVRSRRYESAGALADDLERFLAEKPVVARPPSVMYRTQKFLQRTGRRLNVPAVLLSIILITIIGRLVGSELYQSIRGNHALTSNSPKTIVIDGEQTPSLRVQPNPQAPVTGRDFPGLLSEPTWKPEIGRWQLITKRPRGVLRSAVWSPNEDRFALCESNHVRIYDAENLRLQRVLVGHTQPVRSVAWDADGKRLASASEDGTVRLWTDDGRPTHQLVGHEGVVYQVAWRPNSDQLASASADGTVRLWNSDGTIQRVIEEGERHVFCLDWRNDGAVLATGGGEITPPTAESVGGSIIRLWDPDTGDLIRRITGANSHAAQCIDWHPSGQQLAVGYGNAYRCTQEAFLPISNAGVTIWDASGNMISRIDHQIGTVYAVAWDPAGRRVAFGGRHGTVWIGQPDLPEVVDLKLGHKLDLYSLCWRKNGSGLLSASRESIREWRGEKSMTPLVLGLSEQGFKYVKWSPQGGQLASQGNNGYQFWTAEGNFAPQPTSLGAPQVTPWWSHQYQPIRPDGQLQVFLQGGHPSRMREWDWNKQGWIAGVSWSDASVRIWNEQGQLINTLLRHRGGVESVSWSPEGDWLASGGGDSVRLWRANGTPGPVMRGHSDEVYPVAWSPDGQWIASGASDSLVRLWKPDGTPGPIFRGHTGGIHDLAWSPDSSQLASASWLDSTLRLWDVSTGKTLWQAVLIEPDKAVVLSPQGLPLGGDEELVDAQLACVVERLDGATDLVSYKDLMQRFAKLAFDQGQQELQRAVETRKWEPVEAKYREALTFKKHLTATQLFQLAVMGYQLANGLLAQQSLERASENIQSSLELRNDLAFAHILQGRIHQKNGEKEQATQSFQKAIDLQSKITRNWRAQYELALLRLAVDDREGYQADCRSMLQEFAGTTDVQAARFTAWTIALAPDSVEDYSQVEELSRLTLTIQPDNLMYLDCYGAVLCRAGKYAEAIRQLTEVDELWEQGKSQPQTARAYLHYFLAIACYRAGDPENGEKWLSKAEAQEAKDIEVVNEWYRELTFDQLRREVRQLQEAAAVP